MKKKHPSLDDLLDEIQFSNVSITEHPDIAPSIDGWWHVSDNRGVFAYFAEEADAARYRLAEINRRLNP